MNTLNVNITKLVPEAAIPQYSRDGDVGLDLVATSCHFDANGAVVYGTGIAIEIPKGYYGDLRARSSNAKFDLLLSNGLGTVDSNYRGELILKFKPSQRFCDRSDGYHIRDADCGQDAKLYEVGDKIGQLLILPYPLINFIEVESLSDSNRGTEGFGSSGK